MARRRRFPLASALLLALPIVLSRSARALEVGVSAAALERTVRAQLFNSPEGRYYMRGDPHSACFVYADHPEIFFRGDRIVVRVHARGRLGTGIHGSCLGVGLSTIAEVSLVPDAEGESVGFRDARIEKLSESKELNFLLVPFLSGEMPAQMKLNAADLMRKLLVTSQQTTGYTLTLSRLKLHSMLVENNALVVDLDADMRVD